jgi:hypothetical protein
MNNAPWADLLPDLLNLIAYTLTEGVLLGHSQSVARPLMRISDYSCFICMPFRGFDREATGTICGTICAN